MKKTLPYLLASLLGTFGLLTLFLSSSVMFDWFGIRAKEGNYVLLVVIANFMASILYLFSALGFVKKAKWTSIPMYISLAILIAAFAGLFLHIHSGGIYESKTIGAMVFRIMLTLGFAISAHFLLKKTEK
jgi:predicted RND superfamily exporter protein